MRTDGEAWGACTHCQWSSSRRGWRSRRAGRTGGRQAPDDKRRTDMRSNNHRVNWEGLSGAVGSIAATLLASSLPVLANHREEIRLGGTLFSIVIAFLAPPQKARKERK